MLCTWSEKSGVERVRPIGGHDHLDLAQNVEAIHLVEQLHQRALNLPVGRGALAEPATSDRINLVHEYDTGLVIARVVEHFSDEPRTLADILVHNGRGDNLQEVGIELGGDRARKEGLSGTRGSIQETAFRRGDADPLEELCQHANSLRRHAIQGVMGLQMQIYSYPD